MWRAATQKDDSQIVQMCLELNREDPGIRPVEENQIRKTLFEIRQHPIRGKIWVLDLESEVCGYSFLMSFWSNELGGEICYIDELFVAKKYRQKGYGTYLIQSLVNRTGEFWDKNCVALDLEVTPDNHRALALYASLGFIPWKNSMQRLRF